MKWEMQGLGFLRLKISRDLRLHVWDDLVKYPGASPMHTHSWDFTSRVVAGRMINHRFVEDKTVGTPMWRQRLRCGRDCKLLGPPERVLIRCVTSDFVLPGQTYSQRADEIHMTEADPGTVTLVHRVYDGADGEANVYYEDVWGTAEPQDAPQELVEAVLARIKL